MLKARYAAGKHRESRVEKDIDMNYYELLEVSEKSSTEVITGAYKALVKKYHPDVSKDAQANEKMRSINLAYEVLTDPKKKSGI